MTLVVRLDAAGPGTGLDDPLIGRPHPPPPSWRPFVLVALITAAFTLGGATLVWLAHADVAFTPLVSGVLTTSAALLTASAAATARGATGRSRTMWWLLAVTGVLWTLGELTRGHGSGVADAADHAAGLGWSDAARLLALIPATAMLLWLVPKQARSERRRHLLGALVMGGSIFFLVASLAPHTLAHSASAPALTSGVWMAYPIADIALASLAFFVLAGKRYEAGPALSLVASGFILFAVAGATGHGPTDTGTVMGVLGHDVARLLGFTALVLAARTPGAAHLFDSKPGEAFERPASPRSLLLFVPLLSLVIVVSGLMSDADDVVLRVLEICTLLLFGLRQALIARDASRLHDQVEARVEELQRTSASLARLAHQNERTIESVSDGIFGVDTAGRVTFANAAAVAMIGCDEREIVGATPAERFLARGVDGYGRSTANPIEIALGTGRASGPRTAVFSRRDGSEFPVEWSAGPVEDNQGTNVGAVVVFRDITRRRELERLKDDFVSVVNHELRTPLTSIRGVLGLLDGGVLGDLTPRGRSLVRGGVESAERLARLVNDLLDFDRIESGAATLLVADCDVEHLVRTAVDGVRPLATAVPVLIEMGPLGGRVRADGDRIVQTLTNLLGNAIKFSPPHTTIRVSTARRSGYVAFTVSDQGRGIPPEKLEQVFERFEQVDSSDSRLQGGTGLGLAISRTIVRKHGGEIWAESRPGKGSAFHFTIPAAGSQRAEPRRNGPSPRLLARVRDLYQRGPEAPAAAGVGAATSRTDPSA